uniref:Uncharacterized protein n=1 Tax=Caenorhabditis japonica TaxID=281687 RepID=A0A8R1DH84_CAEJA
MDFDGGPPPFVIDDVKDLNHHHIHNHLDDFDQEDVEDNSKIPLPELKSRSPTPLSPDENDKGDAISIAENQLKREQVQEVQEDEDRKWGDIAAPAQ